MFKYKWLVFLPPLLLAVIGIFYIKTYQPYFGAGYSPVTGYESRTTARIAEGATTIPVASVSDYVGDAIAIASISSSSTPRVYFSLEPDNSSRRESFYCTGISGLTWTGCVGGLSPQGGSLTASSTLQHAHPAGSKIIMTNIGQFYSEFVSINGTQTINDVKTFSSIPAVTSSTAIPISANQLVSKYYADSLVAGGLSSLNASTSLGIAAFSGLTNCSTSGTCFGINISTTSSGLTFENAFAGKLKVNASSTSLAVDSLGKLYWDRTLNYLVSGNWTTSGIWSFSGNVTSTGNFTVNTPTSTRDVANKGYVDSTVSYGSATGTAGMAITAGDALYISTTSTLFKTNSSVASSTFQFIGIAQNTVSVGGTVTFARPGETICNQSGLSAGYSYFLNGTAGQISTTAGTKFARIGRALSSSCLLVIAPKFIERGTFTPSGTGDSFQTTGFYPARVEVWAGPVAGDGGISVGDDTNQTVAALLKGASNAGNYDATKAWIIVDANTATTESAGTISSKTATGFMFNVATHAAGANIMWTAYSE